LSDTKQLLVVHSSPHFHSSRSTSNVMLDVIIALIPALAVSVWLFGPRALIVTLICASVCVVAEYITRRILKRDNAIGDLSAVVTGLLLGFNLPPSIPFWMAGVGALVAIVVVKQMFGGLGFNFVNPALIGRIALIVSFPKEMSAFTAPFAWHGSADAVTSATPLGILNEGSGEALPSLADLFLGRHGGSLGETCALALLIGGIYLVVRRVISPVIPLCYICTTVFITTLFGQNPLVQLLSGGLILGAVFMATDYVTSPVTFSGKIIFAFGCGVLTAVIRLWGSMPEGVSFSIIIMNILVPYIERATQPVPFGVKREKEKRK
jgi:electron transport complex protein RnfD